MKASEVRQLSNFGILIAIVIVIAAGWALYRSTLSQIESSRLVGRSHEIIKSIVELNGSMSRASAAQRGFRLSGNEDYLAERDKALNSANTSLALIKTLTANDPIQQENLSALESLIKQRTERFSFTERARRNEGIESSQTLVSSGIGSGLTTKIYDLTNKLIDEEQRLLASRVSNLEKQNQTVKGVLIIAILVAVIMLIPGYLGFAIQTKASELAETKLADINDGLVGIVFQLKYPRQGEPHYTFISSGITRVLGFRPKDAMVSFDKILGSIHEEDRPKVLAYLAKVVENKTDFSFDYRMRHFDGTYRWLHTEASIKRESDGGLLVNGFSYDIGRQKQLEIELQNAKEAADAANRAKGTFLAMMSHEIRTPMNGMFGMLELLSLSKLDTDQRYKVALVRESGKTLLRIIDDILDFSKIEAGKLDLRPEATSIRDVISSSCNLFLSNASSKGAEIRESVDNEISDLLVVDQLRLKQILNNFLSNAIKFTPKGGTIDIGAELVDRADGKEWVQFSVKDTGAGISPENQRLIFKPFSQGDSITSRRAGGTGLGLAICWRLAELMGGSIEMQSTLGRGTLMAFIVALPVADKLHLEEDNFAGGSDDPRTTGKRRGFAPETSAAESDKRLVLLVDDNLINRQVLMGQLNSLGYSAESAEDGFVAMEKWKSGRFNMVITDCQMPEMDGYELTRRIRLLESSNGSTRTPIVACTANALVGEEQTCLAAGMDDYLAKPFDLSRLRETLDRWLPIA